MAVQTRRQVSVTYLTAFYLVLLSKLDIMRCNYITSGVGVINLYFTMFLITDTDAYKTDPQQPILPTIRTILSNPLTRDFMMVRVIYKIGTDAHLVTVLL